ncbi:hypothetical protein GOZ97_23970 [Agrobacterium vitis]|uniref:hypothetical protein n=1 Tax=Rhizobium/Agrobacterium group TaxID=227290 RepID=UPI001113AD2A|nr:MULTISPECIES: hypothetical protein [Rhizobium/Agrobacterium group]MCF1437052.1 hypothetical protein [Allorhizobium ampelinum]MUO91665.1 hypothetical protein [Agrobacterium vitis]MUZ55250.1 hypothetical protein [Agrobacterium vitis]MUZ94478.1 hypothetical protein [Agrobacterium vitis]MVA42797.1 hypothetical protein [Agrobacterium vitis]
MTSDSTVTELPTIPVTAPPEAQNSSNATEIKGKASWKTCWRHACYLSKYIYKDPPPPNGFHTQFPEKMADVETHWEKWDEFVDQTGSGLVARLFKVKGYDPNSKTDLCPPTLVFRGTDFEDMRDLAIVPTIKIYGYTVYDTPFLLDKTIAPATKPDDLLRRGFKPIRIYEETGTVRAPGSIEGTGFIDAEIFIQLDIYAKENGDWTSNIYQGLGKGSSQYKKSIDYGRKITSNKIIPSADKRLEISGHSLGGGLASAVCVVLDHEINGIYFHSIVFNPAGVHPNTINPATAADGHINVFTVNDEILTTVENYRGKLPIIGAIFRLAKRTIGQDGMPHTIGTLLTNDGISPGKSDEKWAVPPKGKLLPKLFPIGEQNLIKPPKPEKFPEITNLDNLLNGSASATDFANKLLVYLHNKYVPNKFSQKDMLWLDPRSILTKDILDYSNIYKKYKEELQPEIDALMKIIEASISYHGMDYVIATYDRYYGGA